MEEKWNKLKGDWFEENGMQEKDIQDVRKLTTEIRNWIREFVHNVNNDEEGIGAGGCAEEYEGKTLEEGIDKEVCSFILGTLWNMQTKISAGGGSDINKEMEAYVYCAIMSAWFYWYRRKYCDADKVMKHAFGKMEELSQDMDTGGRWHKCEYENLAKMEVAGRNILEYILPMVKYQKYAMGKMYKKIPKIPCPQKESKSAKDAGVGLPSSSTGSGINMRKIWDDFKKTFDNLIKRLGEDEPDEIKHLCADVPDWTGGSEWNKKELCKAMLRIRYFMNGIVGGKFRGDKSSVGTIDDEEAYKRCIVGMISTLEFFQWHCKFEEIAEYTVGPMNNVLKKHNLEGKFEKCKDIDPRSLVIGKKIVGNEIKKWVEGVKKSVHIITQIEKVGKDHCEGEKHAQKLKEQEEKNRESVIKLFGRDDKKELGILTNTSNDFPMERVDEKLKEMEKAGTDDAKRGKLVKEIEEIIENASGCSVHLGPKVQDGEEENWGELFTKFSNHPLHSDIHYDREKFNVLSTWCDVEDDDDVNLKEHKEFCKLLLKNLLMVGRINYSCEGEVLKQGGKKWCVKACDLLNIWLLHIKDVCVSEDVIEGVFKRVHSVDGIFSETGEYTKCMYLKINNLRRDNEDMLNRIMKWMECKSKQGELDEIYKKNWCNASSGMKRSLGWTQWKGKSKNTYREQEGEEYMTKLKEVEKREKSILQTMKNLSLGDPQAPAPPPEPADPAKAAPAKPPSGRGETPSTSDPPPSMPAEEKTSQKKTTPEESDQTKTDPDPQGVSTSSTGTQTPGQAPPQPDSSPALAGHRDDLAKEVANTPVETKKTTDDDTQLDPQKPSRDDQSSSSGGEGLDRTQLTKTTSQSAATKSSDGIAAPVVSKIDNLPDLLTPYLPTIPVFIGMSAMIYLLWKYFGLPGKRKRYKRAHKVRGPPSLEEQIIDRAMDHSGPHEYTLVKERRQPRSVPTGTKSRKKRDGHRRGVRRRMIIDIHLEVLNECQKGDLHLTKEDFFEILVRQFMGSEFIKQGNVPSLDSGFREKDVVPMEGVFKEQVQSSDSGFRDEDFVLEEGVSKEHVPSSDSGFGDEDFVSGEEVPREDVPKEQVPNLDSGFREEDSVPEECVPKEQIPSSDSGFREEDFLPEKCVPVEQVYKE
ncbi:SICA antigen [Plasmodium coatneyi]|uniref:SICA antigen n=1 Tax=Plasmodium coatneyi TaxID=208452 RepID=A0A1B1DUC8_9APIC|nr:SICA antigen [Plasmodium coatneyi]ANQ06249.1 SICA antigen [Plasmodium coatneyi]